MAYEPAIHKAQSFDPRNTSSRCEWLSASATYVRNVLAELDIKLAAPGGITI